MYVPETKRRSYWQLSMAITMSWRGWGQPCLSRKTRSNRTMLSDDNLVRGPGQRTSLGDQARGLYMSFVLAYNNTQLTGTPVYSVLLPLVLLSRHDACQPSRLELLRHGAEVN